MQFFFLLLYCKIIKCWWDFFLSIKNWKFMISVYPSHLPLSLSHRYCLTRKYPTLLNTLGSNCYLATNKKELTALMWTLSREIIQSSVRLHSVRYGCRCLFFLSHLMYLWLLQNFTSPRFSILIGLLMISRFSKN